MRIGLLGKGGSGKSTIAAGLTSYIAKQKKHVLAIDADINVHLQEALNISGDAVHLGEKFQDVAKDLEGKNTLYIPLGFSPIPAFGTIPPSNNTNFIRPVKSDKFLKKYALQKGNISLLTVGEHTEKDLLNGCFHNKLNTLELIFHRIIDRDDEFVVTDSTAGVDSLGTSMFLVHDITLFVVEPTPKSVSVYLDYVKKTKEYNVLIKVIVNKVYDEQDMKYIYSHIAKEDILGVVKVSENLQLFEQGEAHAFSAFVNENTDIFTSVLDYAQTLHKDWETYYQNVLRFYIKEAAGWWGQYYKVPNLHEIYEKGFRYQSYL